MPLLCEKCKNPTRSVFQQTDEDVRGQLWCKVCHNDRKYAHTLDHTTFMVRDEYGQAITLENYGANPVTFNSESERLAYLKKHDLQHKERWCPFPGTDRDPAGVQNPEGYVDKFTLDNRAELFLRAHNSRKVETPIEMKPFSGHISNQDAVAVATNTDPNRQSRIHRRTAEQTNGE